MSFTNDDLKKYNDFIKGDIRPPVKGLNHSVGQVFKIIYRYNLDKFEDLRDKGKSTSGNINIIYNYEELKKTYLRLNRLSNISHSIRPSKGDELHQLISCGNDSRADFNYTDDEMKYLFNTIEEHKKQIDKLAFDIKIIRDATNYQRQINESNKATMEFINK